MLETRNSQTKETNRKAFEEKIKVTLFFFVIYKALAPFSEEKKLILITFRYALLCDINNGLSVYVHKIYSVDVM